MSKRQKWIECGFDILSESGHENITIEELSGRMGISRGSFFYHFKNRDGFICAMMDQWMSDTEAIIRGLDTSGGFEECYDKVTEGVTLLNSDRELRIRRWAGSEPLVQEYAARVDAMRIESFCGIFARLGLEPEVSDMLAKFRYSLMLGLKQIDGGITPEEVRRAADLYKKLIFAYAGYAADKE